MKRYDLNEKDYQLIELAKEVINRNYDDLKYNHTVGSALLCKNDKIYLGVNCDGVHGSCAEFIAIGNAITSGEREFDVIVAVNKNQVNYLLPPCGNCRQMLFEYSSEIKVILNDENGKIIKVGIKDLLPLAYIHS